MSALPYATPETMAAWSAAIMQRAPDFIIGPADNPYMRRWWVIPRNEGCNVYLHEILRSDDDRAGHDHPWDNTSFIIAGGYDEVVFDAATPWQPADIVRRSAGDWVSRAAKDTHRLIVTDGTPCVSLFLTGPKVRDWGFWCPEGRGFVPWQDFTAGHHGELVGRGCGEA